MSDIRRYDLIVIVRVAVLPIFAVCCGCPLAQQAQQKATPSRWIRIECAAATAESNAKSGLEYRDAEAIEATVQ